MVMAPLNNVQSLMATCKPGYMPDVFEFEAAFHADLDNKKRKAWFEAGKWQKFVLWWNGQKPEK